LRQGVKPACAVGGDVESLKGVEKIMCHRFSINCIARAVAALAWVKVKQQVAGTEFQFSFRAANRQAERLWRVSCLDFFAFARRLNARADRS